MDFSFRLKIKGNIMKSFQTEQKVIFNTVKSYDNETKPYQVLLGDGDQKLLLSWFSSCLSSVSGGDDWILFNLIFCVYVLLHLLVK